MAEIGTGTAQRPEAAPKRRNPWWGWVLVGVGAVVLIGFVGLTTRSSSHSPNLVTYSITGEDTTAGTVTYSTPTGQSQETGVSLPWSVTVAAGSAGSIVAQAATGTTTITCTITENGKVLATQTSNGQYAVVSCGART